MAVEDAAAAVGRLRFAVDSSLPSHTIRLRSIDPGQVLQRVIVDWGGLKPSYMGLVPTKECPRKY